MALRKCKECGEEISSSAKVCPKCGKKQGLGCLGKVGAVILVLFVLGVIGNLMQGKNPSQTTPQPVVSRPQPAPGAGQPNMPPKQTPGHNAESRQAKIGDTVQVGNFVYIVNSVAFKKTVGNSFLKKTADGIYLLVNLRLKNVSNESRTLDGSMFMLKDQDGVKYEYSTEASTTLEMSGVKTLFLKQCQPNIQTSGTLIFEVPDKEKVYHLDVSGGYWSGETANIRLVK